MITLNRICPICGSNQGIELDRICMLSENENILPDEYQIVGCERCGFTYSSMNACQNDFDNYYKRLNIYSEAEDLRVQISDEDNSYFNKIFSLIKPYVSQSSNIIDIGCGGGQLLDYLSRKGLDNLYGLDPSVASVESLCDRGINGIEGSVFDDVQSSLIHHFDLLISTMVLEHIYDLDGYVEKLQEYVSDNGMVLITVPAVEGFEKYICQKPNYFNQEHINFFSCKSIQNLFGKYGLWLINENDCIEDTDLEKCLYLLFKKKEEKRSIVKDDISKLSILNYLDKRNKLDIELNNKISQLVESQKDLVFWGSGQYAKQIVCSRPKLREQLLFFVDNNTVKQGSIIANKEIKAPVEILSLDDNVIICICSMKNGEDIKKQLIGMGIKQEIIVL